MTERLMANPSPMHKPVNTVKTTGSGLFYFDTFLSHHIEGFRTTLDSSPTAEIAGIPMASSSVNLLFDQLIVKKPRTLSPTVWHHGATYWSVAGSQI